MANHNLSSNQYSLNDLDRVSFATLTIFSRIANVDRSSRPVEPRKVSCECDVALEWYCIRTLSLVLKRGVHVQIKHSQTHLQDLIPTLASIKYISNNASPNRD